ncbi:hypothetical protein EHJ07_03580 [Cronobacter muytjensii]|nr:hypothetical protein [Cronobacter muytjensii]
MNIIQCVFLHDGDPVSLLVAIGVPQRGGFNNTTRGKDFNPEYVPITLHERNKSQKLRLKV